MQIGEIKNWDEMCDALEKLIALGTVLSRYESLIVLRALRQRACDLPAVAVADGECGKRATIDTMDWAINVVAEEVGS